MYRFSFCVRNAFVVFVCQRRKAKMKKNKNKIEKEYVFCVHFTNRVVRMKEKRKNEPRGEYLFYIACQNKPFRFSFCCSLSLSLSLQPRRWFHSFSFEPAVGGVRSVDVVVEFTVFSCVLLHVLNASVCVSKRKRMAKRKRQQHQAPEKERRSERVRTKPKKKKIAYVIKSLTKKRRKSFSPNCCDRIHCSEF